MKIDLDTFDLLETQGVYIHYSADHYKDGSNLCFSIEFLRGDARVGTGWYNDNHDFGNVKQTMEASVKIALWYLEKPERIDLINSGYHDPIYREYTKELSNFLTKIIMQNSKTIELLNFEGPVLTATKLDPYTITIRDQWKNDVANLTYAGFNRFLQGETSVTDSSGRTWNYANEHADAKPSSADKISIFLYGSTDLKEIAKSQLIDLLEQQVMDLTIMSKIELGDDVIAELKRLKQIINE